MKLTKEIIEEAKNLYLKGIPIKETLENIKLNHGISVGKTTLYRNLKKCIKIRSISETLKIQNRINLPINEIVRLYVEEKYSIKELAKKFSRNWYTIRKILIENNVKLKDWGEINHLFRTKFVKPKVILTEDEKAYITGLVMGDFAVYQKSKYVVRITTGSTIQAFVDMTEKIFKNYGHAIKTFDKYNNCQKISIDLDSNSFGFLLKMKTEFGYLRCLDDEQFLHFLAGFIDAEGSVLTNKRKPRNRVEFELSVANTNLVVLEIIKSKLEELKFHPHLIKVLNKGKTAYYKGKVFIRNFDQYRISISRKSDIQKLLELLPLRHPEKLNRKKLVLHLIENKITKLNEFLELTSPLNVSQSHEFYNRFRDS